ncbi:MAG: GGDEF domain-containing protein [Paucibacter sp.]|nr:GGDEF domain-containing protein [Roseateles sp.]
MINDHLPRAGPILFLLIQAMLLAFVPAWREPVALIAMVAAPVCAAWALWRRSRREQGFARQGWLLSALAMLIWSIGAAANFRNEWLLGLIEEMQRGTMLAFHLSAVPIAFLLSGDWQYKGHVLARCIDAVLALALGCCYFLVTWGLLTARGLPDDAGVAEMVRLIDIQNLVIAFGSLIRWWAAARADERALFGALTLHTWLYLAMAFINNHFFAGKPELGPEYASIVTVAFVLLWILSERSTSSQSQRVPSARMIGVVRTLAPMALAGGLLVVALMLIRLDYVLGASAVLLAALGYVLRSAIVQISHIDRGSQLEIMALTDALTGLYNRHYLDHALPELWRRDSDSARSVGVLMIDIDHFKRLNDRYGHTCGDDCLRQVAQALKAQLTRGNDVLARWGGEEFMALVWDVDATRIELLAERLRHAVEVLQIENFDSPLGHVSVSIGASSVRLDTGASASTDPMALVQQADRALYQAKALGRNRVEYLHLDAATKVVEHSGAL